MTQVEIKEVRNKNEWHQFIKLPWKIYKNDPLWVPPLLFDFKKQLNQKINPFFKQAKIKYWIALDRNNECIGRIAAIVNHQHNNYYDDQVGFFGYFECVNDKTVS